ncbi:MAG: ABC-2 family transporter protein [Treponema sp.]|jgi:ABC-2 type transport system permease protein|nr:ABC-2 family transporter protein [Treponema sp.]
MALNACAVTKYTALFTGAFKSRLVYRLSTITGIFSSGIFLFIQYSLWKTLISTGIRQDVSLKDMIAYIMITTAAGALSRGDIANQLGAAIRDGSVTGFLLQPMSFRLYQFSSMLGGNCYAFLTSALPVIIGGCVLIGVPAPPSIRHAVFSILITLTGVLIKFEIIYIFGLLAFWTQSTWFIDWYVDAAVSLFGGTLIPLWFYPEGLEKITRFLPFRYISFEGVNSYLGRISPDGMAQSLGMALGWWLVLYGAGKLLWFAARKKLTLNGG